MITTARRRAAGPARHTAQAEQVRPRWARTGRPALHRLVRDRRRALTLFGAAAVALTGASSALATILVG